MMSLTATMACPGCGSSPCACEDILEAHYALYPEDEPTACDMCGNVFTALLLNDGRCERCERETYEGSY